MKGKIKYVILTIALFLIIIVKSNAANYSIDIKCPETASNGEVITCKITATGSGFGGVEANISYNGFTQTKFEKGSDWDLGGLENGKLSTISGTDLDGEVTVGTITLTVNDNGSNTKTISLSGGKIFTIDNSFSVPNVTTTVRVPGTDNNLSSLSIDNGTLSPAFNASITNYTATVDAPNVTISATAAQGSTVTGTGTKSLNYGANTFKVVVTPEAGTSKTYTIVITRPDNRSTNSYLSNVIISSGTINFDKTIQTYDITIPGGNSSFSLEGIAEDSKSIVSYPMGKEITLDYEETKQLQIVVTPEKGGKRTYTFNITRPDNRSGNANLKNVTISSGTINFDKSVEIYDITIPGNNSSFNISGTAEDSKAQVSYPKGQSINLNYGETKQLQITVTAESGATKTYTFNITRRDDRSNNANLKSVTISGGNINFSKDITLYNITIPSNNSSFTLKGVAEDSKATVSPKEQTITLNYGETKQLQITVTSETGIKKVYTFNITRTDGRSNNNNLKSLKISDATINFKPSQTAYTVTVENNIDSVTISGEKEDSKAIVIGLGKKTLKVGSNVFKITVTSESSKTKTYIVTIIRKNKEGETPKLSNNTKIRNITINGLDLRLKDNQDVYTVSVKNSISTVDIKYILDDDKASAILEGKPDLIVGINTFKIIVTAEDGTTKTYQILIERKENQSIVQNDKESIIEAIKNGDDSVITITVKENDKNRQIDQSILKELKDSDKTLIYEVLNENDGLLYSLTLTSEDVKQIEDIDFDLDFNEDTSLKLNDKNVKFLNFKDNGKSSTNLIAKVFVGDKFKDGEVLNLSYYNPKNNKIETIKTNIKVVDGYITFESNKLSKYMLSTSVLKLANNISTNRVLTIVSIIALIIVIVALIIIAIIMKNKNNKNKGNMSEDGMTSTVSFDDPIYNATPNNDSFEQADKIEIVNKDNTEIIDDLRN